MFPASTKASSCVSMAFPDVCKVPAPPGQFVPIPYPSFARTAVTSQQATKTKVSGTGGSGTGSLSQLRSARVTGVASVSASMQIGGAAAKTGEISQLKSGLNQLNSQLQTLKPGDPNQWQAVLQEYLVMASALYVTLLGDAG